jgi:uncharacterized protein (TIGR02145 family)
MNIALLLWLACLAPADPPVPDSGQDTLLAADRSGNTGTFVDRRDRKTYPSVSIHGQVWMAANLDYASSGSRCYDDSQENCHRYGRLYDWNEAQRACPAGWHLPDDAEWTRLENAVGGRADAGRALKSTGSWNFGEAGLDRWGFSVLPGGYCIETGECVFLGDDADFWSATPIDELGAWHRGFGYGGIDSDRDIYYKSSAFSVRCVLDTNLTAPR